MNLNKFILLCLILNVTIVTSQEINDDESVLGRQILVPSESSEESAELEDFEIHFFNIFDIFTLIFGFFFGGSGLFGGLFGSSSSDDSTTTTTTTTTTTSKTFCIMHFYIWKDCKLATPFSELPQQLSQNTYYFF